MIYCRDSSSDVNLGFYSRKKKMKFSTQKDSDSEEISPQKTMSFNRRRISLITIGRMDEENWNFSWIISEKNT